MLTNLSNYGQYSTLVRDGYCTVYTDSINIDNWKENLDSVMNIFRDGIETDFVQSSKINVIFHDGEQLELSIMDYFYNIIMWYPLVYIDEPITLYYLYFVEDLTQDSIKDFIDNKIIGNLRDRFSVTELNNAVDEISYQFSNIDDLSLYLSNTINLEDDIELMKMYPEYRDILHTDLSDVPIEDVQNVAMQKTNKMIEYIKASNHCLADSLRTRQGVNPKQLKEYAVNRGSVPDGNGDIFPIIINSSYINGGINNLASILIDSSSGRVAQIITRLNVADSGDFARLLNLNNCDTILHPDPNYICDSKHFQEILIENTKFLEKLEGRYYRLSENGVEMLLSQKDTHLIGNIIYLRSPMCCASNSRNEGICHRCYGKLAYINSDINIGILASELLSADLTQRLLSAKHLLESSVKEILWTKQFHDLFIPEFNNILLSEEVNFAGYKMLINPTEIYIESEDEKEFNEYIESFIVQYPNGERVTITTEEDDGEKHRLYLSKELNTVIRRNSRAYEDMILIDMRDLVDQAVFLINIMNNELTKALNNINNILDKNAETNKYDRNSILQALVRTLINNGLRLTSIHAEILLSNQIRDIDDVLLKPRWEYLNTDSQVLTLNRALTQNPSVVVSLLYKEVSKTFYNPLSFRRNQSSFLDLLFMERPQEYMSSIQLKDETRVKKNTAILSDPNKVKKDNRVSMITILD